MSSLPERGYPATRREEIRERLHGHEVADPYRWLEEAGSPEVAEWMGSQDALTRAHLHALPGRDGVAARMRELYGAETMGIPRRRGGGLFYSRGRGGREKSVVYVRDEAGERPLLDPNAWSADGSLSLGMWSPSRDGRLVVYAVHPNNADAATLHVADVATGELRERIEGGRYASPSWSPDSSSFVYAWTPTDPAIPVGELPGRVELRQHRIGSDPALDERLHGPTGDPRTFLQGYLSWDGRWLVILISHGWDSVDVLFRDATRPGAPTVALSQGEGDRVDARVHGDRFFIRTSLGAPRGRLMVADAARPGREHWREVVPERPDATLVEVGIAGGRLALGYLRDAASLVEVRELDGRHVRDLAVPELGTASIPHGPPDADEAFYSFSSFTHPDSVFSTSMASGESRLEHRPPTPVDLARFEVRQEWATSRDGTKVSMFVVHVKGLVRDGSHPALMTGYGGFLVPRTASFLENIVPLLERGFVFALPNLRGGSEYGTEWHEAGRRERKQNTFDDFIAAAEHLVEKGYTRPGRLAIAGGSNGGLLVGAAMTQRPELFRAVLCAVPLLDMVRYHLSGAGITWTGEYGSPEVPGELAVLLAYSPYHQVREGVSYPSLLMLSADSDDRVDPMHARKFVAALQHAAPQGKALLRIERHAGHTGADMVKAAVESDADRWAFLLSELGVAGA